VVGSALFSSSLVSQTGNGEMVEIHAWFLSCIHTLHIPARLRIHIPTPVIHQICALLCTSSPNTNCSPALSTPIPRTTSTLLLHRNRQPLPKRTSPFLVLRHVLHPRLSSPLKHQPTLTLRTAHRLPRRRPSFLVRVRIQRPYKAEPVVHH
jgi:hypothetical protein